MSVEKHKCLIWQTSDASYSDPVQGVVRVESSRSGGTYRLAEQPSFAIPGLSSAERARLTTLLIDKRNQGDYEPEVTLSLIDMARVKRPLTIPERAERLLRYMAKCLVSVGHSVNLNWHPSSTSGVDEEAMAWSESLTFAEVQYFLKYLLQENWISERGQNHYNVTVDGYRYIAELNSKSDSAQAFVAMWFNNEMREICENGIKPAIEQAGYKPMRIDKKNDVVKIDDAIVAEIRRSRFLVADSTHGRDGARGGVYYEAGFAFGLGLPVIYTCREDMVDEIHFDTRQYHHTVWKTAEGLRVSLKNRIVALIGDGPISTG